MAKQRIDLDGAVVLVTGAGSGIGAATARTFAERGSLVLAVDIDEVSAKQTTEACRANGRGVAVAYGCDVADLEAVADLTARVHAEHGPLDVLVNNAGVGLTGELLGMTFADWQWVRSINLDGPVHCLGAFGPAMIERGRGHVVNVSSALAYVPRATEPAYVATKSGLMALSRSVRADWRRSGVGVSVVCPGVTNTAIVDHAKFVGRRDDPVARARTAGLFRRGHPPAKVAAAIIDAVDRDRPVVIVGWEARVAWALHRAAPVRLQQRLATVLTDGRLGPRRTVEGLPLRWRRHHAEVGVSAWTAVQAKLPARNRASGGSS
jgi:NAD(P)-dependent dehydrogenase (short-subunit alcohol dehydrogenase family)